MRYIIGEIIIYTSIITIMNNHRNYILIIISLELILISISYMIIYISIIYDDIIGIVNTILILVIGAAETAIGITFLMSI